MANWEIQVALSFNKFRCYISLFLPDSFILSALYFLRSKLQSSTFGQIQCSYAENLFKECYVNNPFNFCNINIITNYVQLCSIFEVCTCTSENFQGTY